MHDLCDVIVMCVCFSASNKLMASDLLAVGKVMEHVHVKIICAGDDASQTSGNEGSAQTDK